MKNRKTLTLAILFADIAKSTYIYETLGDKIAQSIIGKCLSIMCDVTGRHSGTVIKTIGDEVMCTFPTADHAVEAAKEMHMELEEVAFPEKPDYSPPNIYVGIHLGPVISEGGDVFGDAVNVAARMVALAKQRQIVTSAETVTALSPEHQHASRWIDKTTIKGKSGEVKIYEIVWERQDVTIMMDDSPLSSMVLRTRLEINYLDKKIEVDESHPSITLGRQSHNDLIVNENRVSRSHARIEYRRGKFILIDQSTNGTYALIQRKKTIVLKRDEAQLIANGFISLGKEVNPDAPDVIRYEIKL